MEKARALNGRDSNLICQSYKTYAQIEGVTRRRQGGVQYLFQHGG